MKFLKKAAVNVALLMFTAFSLNAQNNSGFGLKGGLNYSANGDYFAAIEQNAQEPDRNIGYHIGLFAKFGNQLYFRPELVYTATKSDYNSDLFEMKKIDVPLLVGINVLGPISVFGGPSLQYILDTDFDGITINNVENDFSVGLNFGIAVNFNKIGIDLRYERGLNNNEANFINSNIGSDIVDRIDTRPDQLILSLSIGL